MHISTIFLSSLGLFVTVRFFFRPMTGGSKAVALHRRPARAALTAATETLANLLFWFTLSAGLTWLALTVLESWKPTDLVHTEAALQAVRTWSDRLERVTGHLGLFAAAAAALGLLWWSFRRTKRRTREEVEARLDAAMTALQQRAGQEELPTLPPDERMQLVANEIDTTRKRLDALMEEKAEQDKIIEAGLHLGKLEQLHTQLDLLRRAERQVEEDLKAEQAEEPAPTGRLRTFFVSKGFHDTLGHAGKVLAICCLMAVIPASLVLTGPVALGVLAQKRIALQADARDFEFAIAQGEINQAWEDAMSGPGATTDNDASSLDEEDEQTASDLAQAFETQFLPDTMVRSAARAGARSAAIRSYARERVRRTVLSHATTRTPAISVAHLPDVPVGALDQQTDALLERAATAKPGPQTPLGRKVRAEALDLARHNPGLWNSVKARFRTYRASFGAVAPPQRLQAIIVNQAIGDVLGSAGTPHGFWSEQARRFGANMSADAASAYSEASARGFLTDFARTGDLPGASERTAARTIKAIPAASAAGLRRLSDIVPDGSDITNRINARRATLSAHTLPVSNAAAVRTTERAARLMGKNFDASSTLVEFSDYFPGYEGQELETRRARTSRSLNLAGAPPARATAKRAVLRQSRAAVRRATSFVRLRGFSRIGGVLIGREAEEGPQLRVDRFDWTIGKRAFRFELAVAGKPAMSFGPFDPAIVHLALLYAADQRPTAVTMVTAPPLPELRILHHPALVDTGLGCRARRLDQFADEVTGRVSALQELREIETLHAEGEIALHNLVRNIQIVAISQTPDGKKAIAGYGAQSFVDAASNASPDERELLAAEIRLSDRATPLTIASRPAYFEAHTSALVDRCRKSGDLASFSACAIKAATDDASATLKRGAQWLAPPVEFQTWSGVREKAYRVEEQLDFLTGRGEDSLGPLRFMVQVAISSPAYFADPGKGWYDPENLAPQEYTDPHPWEFAQTARVLQQALVTLISESAEHKEVYADMVAFTRLQRFFRNALDGALSESFPLEELAKIAEATRASVNTNAPTLRWNPNPGQIERSLTKLLDDAPDKGGAATACRRLANRPDAAGIPPEQWHTACGTTTLSEELPNKDAVTRVSYLNELRDLRFELGLSRDEELMQRYYASGCPRP
ncbi:hypothetical protein C8N35_104321 [Breoghania corrubedonensis]|uniref:Uncharacterized protein n=1 Tax=Breoghania corrubedonensis TaxID=665038 RepID=A0A2T5VAB5_9HYPH|nr:hypothetical protein [Breoghania corrubedonensis]PTW60692.1 hypothetical protein C8N35_104321 [Breoghania corrubedonensis]